MESISSISAAILAGGLGTRLRPAVADRPKALAMVRGRPFLHFLLDQLCAAGIRHVVLCTGHMGDMVRSALDNSYRGMRLDYSEELSPLGTAGGLRLALPLFESDHVLVMNGDSYCQVDLHSFWSFQRRWEAKASLVLTRTSDTAHYGRVQVDHEGRVARFEEKGSHSGPGWINAGVYLIERGLLGSIPSTGSVSIEREIFPEWIGRGLYGFRSKGRFLDIGTPETYAEAQDFFSTVDEASEAEDQARTVCSP